MRIDLAKIQNVIRGACSDGWGLNRHALWNATCVARSYIGKDVTEEEVEGLCRGYAELQWGSDVGEVVVYWKRPAWQMRHGSWGAL